MKKICTEMYYMFVLCFKDISHNDKDLQHSHAYFRMISNVAEKLSLLEAAMTVSFQQCILRLLLF